MEAEVLKYGWLIVLTLAQIVLFWIKSGARKNNKKEVEDNPSDHGERIKGLETDMENVKEDIREIKGKLNRK